MAEMCAFAISLLFQSDRVDTIRKRRIKEENNTHRAPSTTTNCIFAFNAVLQCGQFYLARIIIN